MNLQQLHYFRVLAEVKHFTKAANQIMVSQPSLSNAISDLESELGVPLFERTSRNVSLTKYGELYLPYVERALDSLSDGSEKLQDFIDPALGTISFAYVSSLEHAVPYLLTCYYSERSVNTKFQFHQLSNSEVRQWVLSGKADIGIGTFEPDPNLDSIEIGEHELSLIVADSHPLAAFDSVDLNMLQSEKLLTYNADCDIRRYIDQALQQVGIRPSIALEATQDPMLYSAAAAGYGVALMPKPLGMRPFQVKALHIENPLPRRGIQILWKKTKYVSPAVLSFCDFIRNNPDLLRAYQSKN